ATDLSRPTKSGTTWPGKTTMSRRGRRGKLLIVVQSIVAGATPCAGPAHRWRGPDACPEYGSTPAGLQCRPGARLWMRRPERRHRISLAGKPSPTEGSDQPSAAT